MSKPLLALIVGTLVILGGLETAAQSSRPYPLYRVIVAGARRIPAATVARMTELKVNTMVTTLDVERARQRLLDSGLFASVGYRFTMAGHSLIVSFDVEEPPWNARILFDNFVWFTEDELTQAVANDLPTFAGYAPTLPRSLLRVGRALDRLLQQRGIRGSVSYMTAGANDSSVSAYLFRVDQPAPMLVCAVDLEGVSPSMAGDAAARMTFAVGQDYSREFVRRGVAANLLPLYRERGYARVEATVVRATPAAADDAACPGGIRVSIGVREGLIYTFGGASWSGGGDGPVADLDGLLGLARGAVLNMQVFEDGLQAVLDAFARRGYIAARATPAFSYDDGARTAAAAITIVRGPQMRMGSIEIVGLPADVAERLKESWAIAPGAIYDGLYVREFLKATRSLYPRLTKEYSDVKVTVTPVSREGTMNVVLAFAR